MPIKRVLIFQDGTSNTKFSDTNVSKLYEMVLKDSDQFKKY